MEENIIRIENAALKLGKFSIKPAIINIPKGYIVGIQGDNGAGKSTMLRMLLGMYDKMQGNIYIDGIDVVKNRTQIKNITGVVSQERTFFMEEDAYENERLYAPFYKNWKQRMVKETKGAYIAIYLGLIFSVFMSLMYGFKYDYSSDDKRIMITLTVFIFGVYQGVTTYVSYVRENGKSVNIFEKYKYIPVDVSVLRRVKLILTVRIIAPFVITGQMAAIFVRVIDPDNQGGGFLDISVCMPLIIGCLFILEKFIEYRVLSRKAGL